MWHCLTSCNLACCSVLPSIHCLGFSIKANKTPPPKKNVNKREWKGLGGGGSQTMNKNYWVLRQSNYMKCFSCHNSLPTKRHLQVFLICFISAVPIAKISNLLVGKDCPHSKDRKIKVRYLVSGLPEVSWKYNAQPSIFDEFRGVRLCDETLSIHLLNRN